MIKTKLELKDIAGYLPYGLGIGFRINTGYNTGVLKGYNRQIYSIFCDSNSFEKTIYREIEDIKPILRPFSVLYKTIIHNGEEIVPIMELVKMAFPDMKFIFNDYGECMDESLHRVFEWKENGFVFNQIFHVPNQYQLFDYMNELKIDYRGLIESELAVDVNTLNENPYK